MTDDVDPAANACRLERARRLLGELGYTANSDGSFSPPQREAVTSGNDSGLSPEAARRANAEAAAQGLREHLAHDQQAEKVVEKVARSKDLKPTEALLRQAGALPKKADQLPRS